jgi:hypothetical protein
MQKAITLYEYNSVPQQLRFQHLWDQGTFLTNRITGGSRFNLYALGDFFVEVEYSSKDEMIKGMRTFKSTKLLEDYLDQFQL